MVDNREIKHKDNLEIKKNKIFFLGFIVGITPFILILGIMAIKQDGMEFIPNVFKSAIIIFGIITAITNSFVLRNMFYTKLINLENKKNYF